MPTMSLRTFSAGEPGSLEELSTCFRHALDIREHYERKLERANNLYMELNALMLQLELKERELLRREQALERRCPGLLKSHPSRGILHGNTMEKLIKKRNVPQKLSPHSKRWEWGAPDAHAGQPTFRECSGHRNALF